MVKDTEIDRIKKEYHKKEKKTGKGKGKDKKE